MALIHLTLHHPLNFRSRHRTLRDSFRAISISPLDCTGLLIPPRHLPAAPLPTIVVRFALLVRALDIFVVDEFLDVEEDAIHNSLCLALIHTLTAATRRHAAARTLAAPGNDAIGGFLGLFEELLVVLCFFLKFGSLDYI